MILHGHTSEETAIVIDDYPYGFTLRTKIRYWLETAIKGKGKGQTRFCSQTLNPKTNKWNKPKYSTYSEFMVLHKSEDTGYISQISLGMYSRLEDLGKFLETYSSELNEHEFKQFNDLVKDINSLNKLEWKITSSEPQRVI